MVRLLLVEDDERVAAAMRDALSRQDYEVDRVGTAADALAAVHAESPDLILLDLGLPDGDGLEVFRELQSASDVPVIAVTARGRQDDVVHGLRSGLDDYVVKPFSLAELTARIDNVLRRTQRSMPAESIVVGPISIDLAARSVQRSGEPVQLTRKEFDLLAVLAQERGAVVTRAELLRRVWRTSWEGKSRTVDVHIALLRQKLDAADVIRTVHGVGYQLTE
ncbi:MAG: response regulator transcription factor [Ilumatobacteraceae bacterium]